MANEDDEKAILLPKSLRDVKGVLWRWFTWGDFVIVIPGFILLFLPFMIGLQVGDFLALLPYLGLDLFLLIVVTLLIYPFFPSGKKGRDYLWNIFNHSISKKIYSKSQVKELAVPFDKVSDEGVLIGPKNFSRVIKIKGVDIEIFSKDAQDFSVSSFGRIFVEFESSVTINKFSRRKDYSKWERDLKKSLNDEIKIFMNDNQNKLKNYSKMMKEAEDEDGARTWGDFFEENKAKFEGRKVEQLEVKLNNLSYAIDSFRKMTDDEEYETNYYIMVSNSNLDKLSFELDEIFNILHDLGHSPELLEKNGIIAFLNSYYVKNAFKRNHEKLLEDALPVKVHFKGRKYVETINLNGAKEQRFCRVISVCDFPQWVYRGWMARLINDNEGSVIIKSSDFSMDRALEIVNKKLKVAESNEALAKDNLVRMNAAKEVLSFRSMLSDISNGASLKKVNVFFILVEKNQMDLNKKTKDLARHLRSQGGFRVDKLPFQQKEAFHAIHPTLQDSFSKRHHQTLPTYALQEGYPCTTDRYQDDASPILATTFEGTPVMIDFKKRTPTIVNSNIGIFGKSGSGKSFFSKKVIKDLISQGVKCFVVDPEQEYSLITKTFRGATIDLGGRANKFINPLQFFGTETSDAGEYASHISGVQSFLRGAAGLNDDEEGDLARIITGLYTKFKINPSNAWKVKNDKWPLISDLVKYTYKVASDESKKNTWGAPTLRTLYTKLDRILMSGLKSILWNNYTNVEVVDAPIITFDLKDLLNIDDKSILQTQMKSALSFINKAINENKDKYYRPIDDISYQISEAEKALSNSMIKDSKDVDAKKIQESIEDLKRQKDAAKLAWERKWVAVLVDEAHLLLDSDNPTGAKFLYQMVKRIRKYHGITITITQNIKDFVADDRIRKNTEGILNNQQYRFVFSLSSRDIDDLDQLVSNDGGLTDVEREVISTAGRGQSIAFIGKQRLIMSTFTTPEERKLINGDE